MPAIAKIIDDAIRSGAAPDTLNYNPNPAWQTANRILACGRFPGPLTCEEYPFASTMQGGPFAVTGSAPLEEQRIEAGTLTSFYTKHGLQAGDPFRVEVVNRRGDPAP
jgi:hypothetical protein